MDLMIDNLRKSYDGHVVLDGLTHTFPYGALTCVTGRSGCGKTTLLRLIAGLEAPDAGSIDGIPEGGIAMVFQEDRLPPQLCAADCLRCVLKKDPRREAAIAGALAALGLDHASDQPVREFSGGMRRRVALARALLFPSPLVLLDEPFKGLDADTRRRAIDFTLPLLAGRTTLLVTHDPGDVADLGGTVLRLDNDSAPKARS
jgi:NitT/TauT family transport system ATP-binding protein